MLTRRDFAILSYFSNIDKPVRCKSTPFKPSELQRLEKMEYLLANDSLQYGAPGESPMPVPVYSLSDLGRAVLEDWKETRAETLKSKRVNIATLIISAIGVILTLLSVILSLLS